MKRNPQKTKNYTLKKYSSEKNVRHREKRRKQKKKQKKQKKQKQKQKKDKTKTEEKGNILFSFSERTAARKTMLRFKPMK